MANDPPFATLNHFASDLGIPGESADQRIGIIIKGQVLLRIGATSEDFMRYPHHLPSLAGEIYSRSTVIKSVILSRNIMVLESRT
jgi:hypothetical protein